MAHIYTIIRLKLGLRIRFLAALLALFPGVLFGQPAVWDGTADISWYEDNPLESEFTINTAEELAGLAQLVNGGQYFGGITITLGADIRLNDTTDWRNWDENTTGLKEWTAIGVLNRSFYGKFNGNGHVVSGIYINNSQDYQGLFGHVQYSSAGNTIKNLGVKAFYVRGRYNVGGLVGYYHGTISNSYSTGNVQGNNYVGGLAGHNGGTISNSYSTGNVQGDGYAVGGLAGRNYGGIIVNSYSTGNVETPEEDEDWKGGLVGSNENGGFVSHSYYDSETSGQSDDNGKGTPKTTSYMQSEEFVNTLSYGAGILSANIWIYNQNGYPTLGNTINIVNHFYGGDGTETNPYIIKTKEQFENFSSLVNFGRSFDQEYIELGNDIALNDTANWKNWGEATTGLSQWIPIGTNQSPFRGAFDGSGYAVRGIYISNSNNYQGLFGYVAGTIKKLGVEAFYVKGGNYVGGLVGYGSTIDNNYATGNVQGNDYVGGLASSNRWSTIQYSYATGNVQGNDYVGGLVGENQNNISTSYATGNVKGNEHVGGLVGRNETRWSSISTAYAIGSVSGNTYVGGLAGSIDPQSTISNSYYNSETSGQKDTDKGTPKTTVEMRNENSYSTDWNFLNIWKIDPEFNDGWPYLQTLSPKWQISPIEWEHKYNGLQLKPEPEYVSFEGVSLQKGVDFDFEYGSNLNAGTIGWLTIIGKAPYYGSQKIIFKIIKGTGTGTVSIANWVDIELPKTPSVESSTHHGDIPVFYYKGRESTNYGISETLPTEAGDYTITAKFPANDNYEQFTTSGYDFKITSIWNRTSDTTWFTKNKGLSEYTISSSEELAGLARLVTGGAGNGTYNMSGKTIKLNNNIVLNNTQNWENWADSKEELSRWSPIGTDTLFRGTFDGDGYVVSGLYISNSYSYQGLFGQVGGTIKNLGVEAFYVKGGNSISGCVGGLVGVLNNGGTVSNSYATGNVEGNNVVGGLVGSNNGGTITNSYATGNVQGNEHVGGLVGSDSYYGSSINYSYATGNVKGNKYVGGLVGSNNYGSSIITNSYATGNVQGDEDVGGLVGLLDNGGTITNSYYNSETSGQNDTDKGTPKTTDEMRSENTYTGWNFETVWNIDPDFSDGMPYLRGQTPKWKISPITQMGYTGSQLEPEPDVFFDGVKLTTSDFDYKYGDNLDLGTIGWVNIIGKAPYYGSQKVTFKIVKGTGTGTVSIANWTYKETPKTPSASSATHLNNTAVFYYEGTDYSKSTTPPTEAGNYTVTATFPANDNYNEFTTSPSDFTINKANGSCSVTMQDFVASDTPTDPIPNTTTNTPMQMSYGYKSVNDNSYSSTKPANPGEYEITATFAETANYKPCTATNTFKIYPDLKIDVVWNGCGENAVFTYNGAEQSPVPSTGSYKLVVVGKQINAGSHTAVAELANPVMGVSLLSASCPYTIAQKSLEVTWTTDSVFTYNKMIQAPMPSVPNIKLLRNGAHAAAGIYKDENAASAEIEDQEQARNYNLTNRTKNYEILKKDLKPYFTAILPPEDFKPSTDTLWVPYEMFADSATLHTALNGLIDYAGFATDTVSKASDDTTALKGKPTIALQYAPLMLQKRVETTQKATATIVTNTVTADNYEVLTRPAIVIMATVVEDENANKIFCRLGSNCAQFSAEVCSAISGEVVESCEIKVACVINSACVRDFPLETCSAMNGEVVHSCEEVFAQRPVFSATPFRIWQTASGMVNVDLGYMPATPATLQIYDLKGKLLKSEQVNTRFANVGVNVPSGAYLFKVGNRNAVGVLR